MSNMPDKPTGKDNLNAPVQGAGATRTGTGPHQAEPGDFSAVSGISLASSVAGAPCPSLIGGENIGRADVTSQVLSDLSRRLESVAMESISNTSLVVHTGSQTEFTALARSGLEAAEESYYAARARENHDQRGKGDGKGDGTGP